MKTHRSFIFWICIVYKQVQWAHFTFQPSGGTINFHRCNAGSTPGGVLLINFIHSFCWYTSAKPKQTQVMWVYIQITDITKTMTLVVYYLTGLQWAVEISASLLHMLVTECWSQWWTDNIPTGESYRHSVIHGFKKIISYRCPSL